MFPPEDARSAGLPNHLEHRLLVDEDSILERFSVTGLPSSVPQAGGSHGKGSGALMIVAVQGNAPCKWTVGIYEEGVLTVARGDG